MDPIDFIKKKETSFERQARKQGKHPSRLTLTHNSKPRLTSGSASSRVQFLPGRYRVLATRYSESTRAQMHEYFSGCRTFYARKRTEIGSGGFQVGSVSRVEDNHNHPNLQKGEYLVPSPKNPTDKSLVRRLPPDRLLAKLDEIPLEQRNLLSPTMDAMLAQAKIILPGGIAVEGREMVLLLARNAAHSSKLMLKFVHAWELLHEVPLPGLVGNEQGKWTPPTFEQVCHIAGISASDFLGEFMRAAHQYGMQNARLVVDLSAARVVDRIVESATDPAGGSFDDRKLFAQMAGLLPQGGPSVLINNNSNNINLNPGAAQGLPDFSELSKKVEEAVEAEWEEISDEPEK